MDQNQTVSIWLIDDNEADGMIARIALESIIPQADITYFDSGADAVACLQQVESPDLFPDLMLLDLNMPDLDGVAVLKLLAAHELKRFPVFVLSGSTIIDHQRLAHIFDADAFYEKPADFVETVALFKRIIPEFVVKYLDGSGLPA